MDLLNGTIRTYPWGSRTAIAQLCGRPSPAPTPEAELWFGSHPAGSSTVGEEPLVDIIAADPEAALGSRVRATFGDQLPFLMKILAAAEPLSLQAHPSAQQAQEGCAREDAAGIPRTAPHRNYRDANHKPELIIALSHFEALAGFRPLARTIELLQAIDCPDLERYIAMLDDDPEHEQANLRGLFTTWITIPTATREHLVDTIAQAMAQRLATGDVTEWIADVFRNTLALNERYPGDVGVLGALLLNKVNLEPGEAIYLDAGQLHAYVSGLGVEVMANSDNVLRGGLTSKHVDVPELVRVLDFSSLADPVIPAEVGPEGTHYPVPIAEFDVTRVELATGERRECDHSGPAIVLCTAGSVRAVQGEKDLVLHPGDALWIPAADPVVLLDAAQAAQLFIARS